MTTSAKEAASGHWLHVLTQLGVPESALSKPNRPCVLCGGNDRASFTDLEGRGTYYCRACGPHDGFDLLMSLNSWDFKRTAREVERVLGVPEKVRFQPKRDPAKALNRIWLGSHPVKHGDQAHQYLRARGLSRLPTGLRFHPGLRAEGRTFPAMLGILQNVSGKAVSIHRTFLEGNRKAVIPDPKRTMTPTTTIKGAAVRLWTAASEVGLAEGIETAAAAAELFNLPVWACVSAFGLETVELPESIRNVTIFGDEDSTTEFAGQLAAYAAAQRFSRQGRNVKVYIPAIPGMDWNDELNLQRGRLN